MPLPVGAFLSLPPESGVCHAVTAASYCSPTVRLECRSPGFQAHAAASIASDRRTRGIVAHGLADPDCLKTRLVADGDDEAAESTAPHRYLITDPRSQPKDAVISLVPN